MVANKGQIYTRGLLEAARWDTRTQQDTLSSCGWEAMRFQTAIQKVAPAVEQVLLASPTAVLVY